VAAILPQFFLNSLHSYKNALKSTLSEPYCQGLQRLVTRFDGFAFAQPDFNPAQDPFELIPERVCIAKGHFT